MLVRVRIVPRTVVLIWSSMVLTILTTWRNMRACRLSVLAARRSLGTCELTVLAARRHLGTSRLILLPAAASLFGKNRSLEDTPRKDGLLHLRRQRLRMEKWRLTSLFHHRPRDRATALLKLGQKLCWSLGLPLRLGILHGSWRVLERSRRHREVMRLMIAVGWHVMGWRLVVRCIWLRGVRVHMLIRRSVRVWGIGVLMSWLLRWLLRRYAFLKQRHESITFVCC